MQTSNQYARPAGDTMFSLEVKRSSRPQETSKVMKPRILSAQANQSPKFQEKHNITIPIGQSYLDQNHETRRRTGDVLILLPKSSKNSQNPLIGSKGNKNDELVKNMSNLPGYLQRVEKGENLQEKALNFGVLDWESLETWKHKKVTQPRGDASSGSSSMFKVGGSISQSGFINSKSLAPHKKQVSPSLGEGISHDVKQSHVREDLKASSKHTLEGQRKPPRRNQSSGRNQFERCKKEGSDRKIRSKKGTTLSDLRKHEFLRPSKDEKRAQYRVVNNSVEDLQALKYYFGQKHCPGEHRSTVLLLPKHSRRESCFESVQSSELGILTDAKLGEANQEGFSDGFSSSEVFSGEMYSPIPHSCPLPVVGVKRSVGETPAILSNCQCIDGNASSVKPSGANGSEASKRLDHETTDPAVVKGRHSSPNRRYSSRLARISRSLSFKDSSNIPQLSSTFANIKSVSVDTCPIYVGVETKAESDLRRHRSASAQSMELSCDDSHLLTGPIETLNTPSYSNAIRGYKELDQEATEAGRGRHPSPDPHLDFGIGGMSRSFSFKEGSTVPQLSSTYATVKSGPVGSEVSDSLDNTNKNKTNLHGRSRSSPLRRLLDPLLKGRPTNSRHSADINHPLTGNDTSTTQAFLQLTMKNGLPLFKLVANNNNDILVSVKNLTASGKDDSSSIFTFYSVCEIKKKSGSWISQGHKGKNHGFGYNVVGQMKFSGSHYWDLTVQNPNDQFTVKESVLYSVDDRQGDQESVPLAVNREVAAVIVRIPMGNSDTNGDDGKKGKELIGKGFGSTTVILPGGVHGLPNNGAPSPLLERWKSGGSCDCGGWDVGCELRILTDEDRSCNLMEPSISCSSPDQFDLFNQGGGGSDNRPIFSLEPFEEGIYSVQFSPLISLLQAFSVCVAVISNQKPFAFSEANHPSEAELLHESNATGCGRMKTPTKYVPPPPLSPVGRA